MTGDDLLTTIQDYSNKNYNYCINLLYSKYIKEILNKCSFYSDVCEDLIIRGFDFPIDIRVEGTDYRCDCCGREKQDLIELLNSEIGKVVTFNDWSVDISRFDDSEYDSFEEESIITDFLSNFSDEKAERLRKIINEDTYFQIYIDDYTVSEFPWIKDKLLEIGFQYKGRV